MKCYECGKGELKKQSVDFIQFGQNLGAFEAEVCPACKEQFFPDTEMGKIEGEAKRRGVWGLGARTRVGTSGTALDIKIPKALVGFFGLKKGQEVSIEPLDKNRFCVVIEK